MFGTKFLHVYTGHLFYCFPKHDRCHWLCITQEASIHQEFGVHSPPADQISLFYRKISRCFQFLPVAGFLCYGLPFAQRQDQMDTLHYSDILCMCCPAYTKALGTKDARLRTIGKWLKDPWSQKS